VLSFVTGIIPWDAKNKQVMDSEEALRAGHRDLAKWLAEAERLWDTLGTGGMSLRQRWNYNRAISVQFPSADVRVFYAASGTQPAAVKLLGGKGAIAEHKLYWSACKSPEEADFLCAILNSEAARSRAEHWQSEGQWGKRDFDKAVFNLPIPLFDSKDKLHKELAAAAMHAEHVAVRVDIKDGEHFTRTRKHIRDTLVEEGVGGEIEKLVEKLLGPV